MEGSDIELPSALPKKPTKKMPKSPSKSLLKKTQDVQEKPTKNQYPKKLTIKVMIHQVLTELKSKKGVSLYVIKKYLTEKYTVDADKLNYFIKKAIKTAIQEGTIVQTTGSGAAGSFKLAPVKEKSKPEKAKIEEDGNEKLKNPDKPKKKKKHTKKSAKKVVKSKSKESKSSEPGISKEDVVKENMPKEEKISEVKEKKKKIKVAKGLQTPAKIKPDTITRKSIGSIIKKPKMKPKAKA